MRSIFLIGVLMFSCYRYEMFKENRKPMVHFVNGTGGGLVVYAYPTQGGLLEGGWYNVPIDKIDYSIPIRAVRKWDPSKEFYNHRFDKPIASDTVIVIGDPNFLDELIVYTDAYPDTTGNRIHYSYDTNYDKYSYHKSYDLLGNLLSEGLNIPSYIFNNKKPTLNYANVGVGIQKYYDGDAISIDTVKFRGIEKLPIRFKERPYAYKPE